MQNFPSSIKLLRLTENTHWDKEIFLAKARQEIILNRQKIEKATEHVYNMLLYMAMKAGKYFLCIAS